MKCQQADDLIQKALDAPLSAAEREKLDAHVSKCPACARAWTQYRELARTTTNWLTQDAGAVRSDFTASVLARLSAQPAVSPSRSLGAFLWLTGAAAVAAAVAYALLPAGMFWHTLHASLTVPSVSALAGWQGEEFRRAGAFLSAPPAIPFSTMVCVCAVASALAVNILMAQRATRRARRGLA